MTRTGRRPGTTTTSDDILDAARRRFAAHGYDGASIRAIAQDAAVDPALVHHYFGTKQQLFVAALDLPINPATLLASLFEAGPADIGENLARLFVTTWDATAEHSPFMALTRSAVADAQVADVVRDFLARMIIAPLVDAIALPDRELRAGLVASQLMGIILGRYVLAIGPLAEVDADVVVSAIGPTLQRYLTEEL